ncbi:hypothetical protein JHK86_016523 [Glycine max]|nr:hypothetical protein JHK86_016523 [Glycine max]
MNEASNLQQPFAVTGHGPEGNFSLGGLIGNKDTVTGKYPHVFPSGTSVSSDKFVGSQSFVPSNFSTISIAGIERFPERETAATLTCLDYVSNG